MSNPRKSNNSSPVHRRTLLRGAVAATAALAAPSILAQAAPHVRIGYYPVAGGLPFFAAVERGYFRDRGITVEPLKFAGPQQVMEAMISGRCDGSSTGTSSAVLGIGELAQPGLLKIVCTNPSNVKNVLEAIIVPKDSPVRTIADLKGKRVASSPGIQNVTLTRTILERAGAGKMSVVELAVGQHIAALASGQIDAAYTLEPTGTVGRMNGTTRVLEAGVVARYILGDPMAPWHGGSGTLTSEFIRRNPDATKRYVEGFARGVQLVREQPQESRQYLKGYTAIEGDLVNEVPLAAFMMYNEFTPADIASFQKFFDLFTENGIFDKRLSVESLIYRG